MVHGVAKSQTRLSNCTELPFPHIWGMSISVQYENMKGTHWHWSNHIITSTHTKYAISLHLQVLYLLNKRGSRHVSKKLRSYYNRSKQDKWINFSDCRFIGWLVIDLRESKTQVPPVEPQVSQNQVSADNWISSSTSQNTVDQLKGGVEFCEHWKEMN